MVENRDGTLPLANDDVRNRDDVVEAADVAQYPAAGAPRPRSPLAMSAVCLFCLASLFFVGFAVGLKVSHGSSPAVHEVSRQPDTTQRLKWLEPVMKRPKVSAGLGGGVWLGVGWIFWDRIRDACGACAALVCGVPMTFGTWATGIGSWIAYKTSRLMDHVIEESSKFNNEVHTFNDTFKWLGYAFYGFVIISAVGVLGFLGVSVYDRMVARQAAA